MNRLQSELCRLYQPRPAAEPGEGVPELIDADGRVRALVLELARPASWELLSKVWRGVQAELEWPAPAIAVSGSDGFQLWFSLAEPLPAAQAHACLALLCARFLAEVAPTRLRLLPTVGTTVHAPWVPQEQAATGLWSAFVAPDLAPVFTDTPWLDTPPGSDGQADLLARLGSIKPAAFDAALQRLRPDVPAPAAASTGGDAGLTAAPPAAATGALEARHFLLQVMNDETVALALRIEAAKALL